VRAAGPDAATQTDPRRYPHWWGEGLRLSGAALAEVGVTVPALDPDHTALIHVESA
jgi:alpha-galactosidase